MNLQPLESGIAFPVAAAVSGVKNKTNIGGRNKMNSFKKNR